MNNVHILLLTHEWRRKWQLTPVLLPGRFHGWRSLVGYSPWGRKELDTTEWHHFLSFYSSFWRRKWQPTPVFLPGESRGWRVLVGCSPWGCKESDTTEWLTLSLSFTFKSFLILYLYSKSSYFKNIYLPLMCYHSSILRAGIF